MSGTDIYGFLDRAERGLGCYLERVAAGLGLGPESAWYEWDHPAGAYLALDERLPELPGRDVALVWDGERGWAIGVETSSGEDLLVLAWYGPERVPAPEEVVRFAKTVLAGHHPRSPHPPAQPGRADVVRLHLEGYATTGQPAPDWLSPA